MARTADVSMFEIARNITIKVKITHLHNWRFRFWIARKLFKLVAYITKTNIHVDYEVK